MSHRPTPRSIFENPDQYLDFLTQPNDRDFESQFFDRKQLPPPNQMGMVKDQDLAKFKSDNIAPTLSAFSNQNQEGGLLVVGISSKGELLGLSSLSENQINSFGQIDYLKHHHCKFKLHSLTKDGEIKEIALFLCDFSYNAICETSAKPSRAWKRSGLQNIELNDIEIEALRRDKKIVDFERSHCGKYDEAEIDKSVYSEFSDGYLDSSTYEWKELDLLKRLGAVAGNGNDTWFTNAGTLFFSANPERDIPQAVVRLLRFDSSYAERQNRPSHTYEKKFTGSLTKQIRDFRTFIKDSAFFETYQRRNPNGGFIEEPEFPQIAIDEALVNALAHRDYAITRPIFCEKYSDAFVVISPGNIIQLNRVPSQFSLDDTRLEHLTRNPKIMEWLRSMKDAYGRAFVQALQEGTKRMRDEMAKLGLPAPEYSTSALETRVVLSNNSKQRKAALETVETDVSPEFTNLYKILGLRKETDFEKKFALRRELIAGLKNKLSADGWYIDRSSFGEITAHRRKVNISAPPQIQKILQLFPSYIFQTKEYFGNIYLLVDYTVTVQNMMLLSLLISYFSSDQLLNLRCICNNQGWVKGKIIEVGNEMSKVLLFDTDTEETIANNKIIPALPTDMIKSVLARDRYTYDLSKEIKKAVFSSDKNASRIRAKNTQDVINDIAENIFPINISNMPVNLLTNPLRLSAKGNGSDLLRADSLTEPQVEFSKHHASADVREGITQYGSYDNHPKDIELIPLCSNEYAGAMAGLIERLRSGKFKYKGSERTFSIKLSYNTVINASPENLYAEINRLLVQHPEWKGDPNLSRLFLVHCPESTHASDDETSPYYRIKRLLLEAGIPCQMVDTPTLINPDYKDLNLALNIAAKCGQTPWVLPESIPDCDFFVGLSYTQNHRKVGNRIMAFANVFNNYGRWEFFSGGSEVFSFDQRTTYYDKLVKDTLSKLQLSEQPTICFHYTAKFSKEDRAAILKAARSIRPNGIFVFVWINAHHNIRLYDERTETNGSLSRGRYVIGSSNQIYLSTTGNNPYRRAMGTPKPLELNVYIEQPSGNPGTPDLRVLASQVLSLTKLNWASTDSLCAEPITTKYAGDIAYLTDAFMRQQGQFKLHSVLERTPWFI